MNKKHMDGRTAGLVLISRLEGAFRPAKEGQLLAIDGLCRPEKSSIDIEVTCHTRKTIAMSWLNDFVALLHVGDLRSVVTTSKRIADYVICFQNCGTASVLVARSTTDSFCCVCFATISSPFRMSDATPHRLCVAASRAGSAELGGGLLARDPIPVSIHSIRYT